jgi:hypothetical protein
MNDQESDVLDFKDFIKSIGITDKDLDRASSECPYCQNPMEGLTVSESLIDGNGIFSLKQFSENNEIGVLFRNDGWTLAGRFMNHSKTPNSRVSIIEGNMVCIANQTIDIGEEITLDYRQAGKSFHSMIESNPSKCGGAECIRENT